MISMTGPGVLDHIPRYPLEPDGIFLSLAAYPVTREYLLDSTRGKPTTVLELTTTSTTLLSSVELRILFNTLPHRLKNWRPRPEGERPVLPTGDLSFPLFKKKKQNNKGSLKA